MAAAPSTCSASSQQAVGELTPLFSAIERTCGWLIAQQHDRGFWCAELEGDTILESEYVLLLAWLGRERTAVAERAARYLLNNQLPKGGWAQFPGGAADISVSAKAYFALKLTGHDPESEPMQRARRVIRSLGGADRVNSFTRYYFALLGQISYDHCPAVPPEAVLLPGWLPISIYQISAWSRTIFVPLSIIWAHRPVRPLSREQGIGELFLNEPDDWPELRNPGAAKSGKGWSWERTFRALDGAVKALERWNVMPLRRRALRAAESWMTQRFAHSDGLGAIFPPIIWSLVALKCQGYSDDSAQVRYCHEQLEALMLEDGGAIRLQPCKSPVWDTALTLRALAACGIGPSTDASQRAVHWLLKKEVTRRGDWSKKVKAEPGGWYFEHLNEFYPDVDDSVMVLMALCEQMQVERAGSPRRTSAAINQRHIDIDPLIGSDPHRIGDASLEQDIRWRRARSLAGARRMVHSLAGPAQDDFLGGQLSAEAHQVTAAVQRACRWVLAMQNRDGGWGAFDKDNHHEFLCHVPFADHNAMIDPSTPDLTGRVLEALAMCGMSLQDKAVQRGVAYLRATQEPDGAWFGRWGVNYIYGTWQVLVGLAAVGVAADDESVEAGVRWLLACQQENGGWGESPRSYACATWRGKGPTTASQTAWALLGLMTAGNKDEPAVRRGIDYLLRTQQADGTWHEPEFTGTGFPLVFYLRYHMYPVYFPLLALARWTGVQQ